MPIFIFCFLISSRYLVPRDMSVGQFIHILSSRLHLTPGKALFVFVKNTLPQTGKIGHFIYLKNATYVLLSMQLRCPTNMWHCLQQAVSIQSMNLTRMMMVFCICATAARKPLANLYHPFPWIFDFMSVFLCMNNSMRTCLRGLTMILMYKLFFCFVNYI